MDSLFTFHDPEKHLNPRLKLAVKILVILLVILLLVHIRSCSSMNKAKMVTTPMLIRKDHHIIVPDNSPLRAQLVVQAVKTSNAPHIATVPGLVEADPVRTVNVLPPLTGHLVDINVKLGDEVKRDQLLATMQSAGLALAYSDLTKANSVLKQTKEALNRAQKVNKAGANAIKEIEQAQSNYSQAQAELERAQEALTSLGNNQPSQLRIQAPIDGRVIALNYGIGSFINDATAPILTISNIQSVWISACIPEILIASVAKGQKVRIALNAYPNHPREGKITFINNLIDPDARCNKTRIALTNPEDKLQLNMFAKVSIVLPQPEQVFVPLSAILMNNDTTSVFVETAPWTFEPRPVELGMEDGNMVRIRSGLKAGDRIVASGGILVND